MSSQIKSSYHPNPALGLRRIGKFYCLPVLAFFVFSLQLFGAETSSLLKPDLLPNTDGKHLLDKYCFECHGDGAKKGKFALDDLLQSGTSPTNHVQWEKSWKMVRQEFMPPAEAEIPSEAERKAITHWIEQAQLGVDHDNPDPGRVTIRRLNRMEYDYTITDLFGANLSSDQDYISDSALEARSLRDRLPPDDTAFGFDNNGDFLSLSPALLEKFFNLAEFVVDNVIVIGEPRHPRRDLSKNGLKTTKTEASMRVEHTAEFEVKLPGNYHLDIQFNAGNFAEILGTFEFLLQTDKLPVVRDEILIGGHKTHRYSQDAFLQPGLHHLTVSTVPIKADAKGRLRSLDFRPRIKLTGPIGTGVYEYPDSHRKIFFQGEAPAAQKDRRIYARAIVQRVADRAFRRPAGEATLDRLTEIVMRNDQFDAGVGQALTAILASPKFLFRSELQAQPDDPKSVHPIDEYALASRLSYLLWLSLPDQELTELAAQGKLRQNFRGQVMRMLADAKSSRFFEDFPGQWLRTRNVLMTAIAENDGPLNPVRGAMKRETEMLFEYVARQDRDLLELVTADYTFVDKKLADYYGLKTFSGEGFQKVSLPVGSDRGGILTHGSFLVSTSNPNRTSPVKRGLFVLENLLATQIPPPPDNIPPLDDAKVGGVTPATVREQLAIHRANKSCAACHAHFDPIGLVLENYDTIGQWRDKEGDAVIVANEKALTGETLSGVADIRTLFSSRKSKFYRCATEKLITYAVGRGLEPSDAVTVDRITDQLMADNGKFSTLLMAVVESPIFQMRRGDDGQDKTPPRTILPTPPPPEQRKTPARRNRKPIANKETKPLTVDSVGTNDLKQLKQPTEKNPTPKDP